MNNYHVSVLLQEAIQGLNVKEHAKYIDATLGGGGHTKEIIAGGGIVLGIDQDTDALEHVQKSLEKEIQDRKLQIAQGNFNNLENIAKENGFENVSGILFDIGVSSYQLDTNERGFSFLSDSALDMRMDKNLAVSAKDLVNGLTKGELIELLTKYGEEPFAKRIADVIVSKRLQKPIETTKELADLIAENVKKLGKIHPATKTFQALRIAVNDELNSLEEGLAQAITLLEADGRLVVISFHSLEDRIVKNTFELFEKKGLGKIITKKPVVPADEEIWNNKRARSAKLRIFAKA